MKVYHFDFFCSALVVECHAAGTEMGLLDLVGDLEVPFLQLDKPVARLVLKQGETITATKDHEFFLESEIEPFGAYVFSKDTLGWSMHQEGAFTGCFEFGSKTCELVFDPDCSQEKIGVASAFAIDHALGVGGQAMIHAASLDVEDGWGRIAIHAKSGTGKTTLALALAKAGYRICSDDASVITSEGNQETNIWGLPRNPKIFPETITMINAIDPMILNYKSNHRGKLVLSRAKMRNAGLLARSYPEYQRRE